MFDYYDPDGNPIEMMEWAKSYGRKWNRLTADYTANCYVVSTVYLGLDHGYPGIPLIYETMVFSRCPKRWGHRSERINFRELICRRYSTREEALAGHLEVLRVWRYKDNLMNRRREKRRIAKHEKFMEKIRSGEALRELREARDQYEAVTRGTTLTAE